MPTATDQLPVSSDKAVNSLLLKLWDGMKEASAAGTMMLNAHQHLAPAVISILKSLGLG